MKKCLTRSALFLIMKFSLLPALLIFSVLCSYANVLNGQDLLKRKISIHTKGQEIKRVLSEIEGLTDAKFVYSPEIIGASRKVTLSARNEEVASILMRLLGPLDVTYEVVGQYIILRHHTKNGETTADELLFPVAEQADRLVRGRVTGTEGNPISGVNVTIRGGQTGVTTDANGDFSLSIPELSVVLIFSHIGYLTQEIPVTSSAPLSVVLQADAKGLSEVVVMGYGTQKRSDITGSVGSIAGKHIENRTVGTLDQALIGKVSGLSVSNNSGSPGTGMMIRIRGVGTINNSDPLYVVDGNPFGNVNNLDVEDIQSVEVLKSASAAAIYGSRGANGVVLITTKRGVAGQSRIDLNAFTGFQQLYKKLDLTDAATYARYYNEALISGGLAPVFDNPASFGKGTDWQDAVFRTAPIYKYEAAVSGGKEGSVYRVSGSYLNQQGIVIGTDFTKVAFTINSSNRIKPWLRFGENINYSYTTRNNVSEYHSDSRGIIATAINMSPTVPVKNPDGSYGVSPFANTYNPVAAVENIQRLRKQWLLVGSLYGQVDIARGFDFKSQFNLTLGNGRSKSYVPVYFVSASQKEDVNSLEEEAYNQTEWALENTLNYNREFGKHSISGMLGITAQHAYYSSIWGFGQELPEDATRLPALQFLDLASSGQSTAGGADEWGMLSFFGRMNYGFQDKYLATVNIRRDGSSKFGKNNRYGTFPSFSLGWRISNEPFFKGITFVDDLKLRGGWGELGNEGSLSTSATVSTLRVNIPYPFGRGDAQEIHFGATPLSIGNPNLKWESTRETDIGLDATLFNRRLTFSADYYRRKTSGILVQLPILASVGVSEPPYVNGGDVLNHGVEFTLGYRSSDNNKVIYEINFNYSVNHNKVTHLANEGAAFYAGEITSGVDVSKTVVGQPIGSFFGYVTDGVFQTADEINKAAVQTGAEPGDIRFKDLNGDRVIDDKDQTFIGSPWPTQIFGLSGNVAYRNFDLSMTFSGRGGNQIYAGWKFNTNASGISNYFRPDKSRVWTGPGTSKDEPRITILDPNYNMRPSTRWIESGTFIRASNIQLGYNLPRKLLVKWGVQRIRVYISGENLFTITQYDGYDPEVGMREGNSGDPLDVGIDRAYYSRPRSVNAGFNITL